MDNWNEKISDGDLNELAHILKDSDVVPNPDIKPIEKELHPKYKSKQGFETIPLHRGFTELKPIWDTLERARAVTGHDCFICGGYARYCASPVVNPVQAGDADIYCDHEEIFKWLKDYFTTVANIGIRHENDVSLTFSQSSGDFKFCPTIQLVKPIKDGKIVAVGDRKTILDNFDFTIVRACIMNEREVLVDADFVNDEEGHILRLKNIHCPISSTLRCMKYAKKGYWLKATECIKLFIDWDNRSDDYRLKLLEFFEKMDADDKLTEQEVEQLESLMRID